MDQEIDQRWAYRIVRVVMMDLQARKGIRHAFEAVDDEIYAEIEDDLRDKIAALLRRMRERGRNVGAPADAVAPQS